MEDLLELSPLEQELEALVAIYLDEIEIRRKEDGQIQEIAMVLHPSTGDDETKKFVRMDLVLQPSCKYPDEAPDVFICNPRGLGEEEVLSLLEDMKVKAQECVGEVMLYTLIEMAKETLTDGNIPHCPCVVCLEHFHNLDLFQRTACYHYFHRRCLHKYLTHSRQQLEVQREEEAQHKQRNPNRKPEDLVIVCPVCRCVMDDVSLSVYCSDSEEEDDNDYAIPEEFRLQQEQMALLFEKQKAKGAIIDVEGEKNKFLVNPDEKLPVQLPLTAESDIGEKAALTTSQTSTCEKGDKKDDQDRSLHKCHDRRLNDKGYRGRGRPRREDNDQRRGFDDKGKSSRGSYKASGKGQYSDADRKERNGDNGDRYRGEERSDRNRVGESDRKRAEEKDGDGEGRDIGRDGERRDRDEGRRGRDKDIEGRERERNWKLREDSTGKFENVNSQSDFTRKKHLTHNSGKTSNMTDDRGADARSVVSQRDHNERGRGFKRGSHGGFGRGRGRGRDSQSRQDDGGVKEEGDAESKRELNQYDLESRTKQNRHYDDHYQPNSRGRHKRDGDKDGRRQEEYKHTHSRNQRGCAYRHSDQMMSGRGRGSDHKGRDGVSNQGPKLVEGEDEEEDSSFKKADHRNAEINRRWRELNFGSGCRTVSSTVGSQDGRDKNSRRFRVIDDDEDSGCKSAQAQRQSYEDESDDDVSYSTNPHYKHTEAHLYYSKAESQEEDWGEESDPYVFERRRIRPERFSEYTNYKTPHLAKIDQRISDRVEKQQQLQDEERRLHLEQRRRQEEQSRDKASAHGGSGPSAPRLSVLEQFKQRESSDRLPVNQDTLKQRESKQCVRKQDKKSNEDEESEERHENLTNGESGNFSGAGKKNTGRNLSSKSLSYQGDGSKDIKFVGAKPQSDRVCGMPEGVVSNVDENSVFKESWNRREEKRRQAQRTGKGKNSPLSKENVTVTNDSSCHQEESHDKRDRKQCSRKNYTPEKLDEGGNKKLENSVEGSKFSDLPSSNRRDAKPQSGTKICSAAQTPTIKKGKPLDWRKKSGTAQRQATPADDVESFVDDFDVTSLLPDCLGDRLNVSPSMEMNGREDLGQSRDPQNGNAALDNLEACSKPTKPPPVSASSFKKPKPLDFRLSKANR